ncbi:MAG TPA: DUF4331 family protein [Thermodesulfobacteriota bacterium]|nr:DUF4331 family protein [Thermodesulfobacteriota bacterium]
MKNEKIAITVITVVFLYLSLVYPVHGSDHSDTPLLIDAGRNDARITDMYAFTRGANLVLILCVDPSVPIGATTYKFPRDVEYAFHIDNDAELNPDGTLVNKKDIHEDIIIKVRFREDGTPDINVDFVSNFFSGTRDDPFIRGPQIGKNIAAIVLEVPLDDVLDESNTLLIWATTKVDGLPGKFQERFGSPFNSQINTGLNRIHPKDDFKKFGLEPDVAIINTALSSRFPNGRALEDDVVDIMCSPPSFCEKVFNSDAPFPPENDVLFLPDFPYLAPPH